MVAASTCVGPPRFGTQNVRPRPSTRVPDNNHATDLGTSPESARSFSSPRQKASVRNAARTDAKTPWLMSRKPSTPRPPSAERPPQSVELPVIGAADGVITAGAGADVTVPFVIEGSGSRGESTMLPKMRTSAMEARPARKMIIDINMEQYLSESERRGKDEEK